MSISSGAQIGPFTVLGLLGQGEMGKVCRARNSRLKREVALKILPDGFASHLKNRHPDWSPMAIESALMTNASDVLDGGTPAPETNPALIFRQGAGHVVPNSAADPGLLHDAGVNDWLAFLCGMTTVVSPSSLTLAPGATGAFSVTVTRTTAPLNTYVGGQLRWTDGSHTVRIPMVVRPVPLSVPSQVSGTGGPISYPAVFGYTGAFAASARGLVAAALAPGTVSDDPGDDFDPAGPGVTAIPVAIPPPRPRQEDQ